MKILGKTIRWRTRTLKARLQAIQNERKMIEEILFRLRYLWFKLTKPFKTFIYIHQRTKITVRQFPFKLKIERVPSLQERINATPSGVIPLESAIYLIDEPIELKTGITLQSQKK